MPGLLLINPSFSICTLFSHSLCSAKCEKGWNANQRVLWCSITRLSRHRSTRYKPSWSCPMHKGPWLTSWLIDPLDRTWTSRRRAFSTNNGSLLKFDFTFETKRRVVACHSVADDIDDGVSTRSYKSSCPEEVRASCWWQDQTGYDGDKKSLWSEEC